MTRGRDENKYGGNRRPKSCVCHLNSLSSLSYCVVTVGLSTYVISTEVLRFLRYLDLPWPSGTFPNFEINVHLALVGISAVLLPFFFCCAVLKVGNFANDGFRLGTHDGACSKDPPPIPGPKGGIWMHGGPIAPLLHLALAHALLMAKMVLETKAVDQNFLPQDHVWRSELSALLPERGRLSKFWLIVNHAFSPAHARGAPGIYNTTSETQDLPYTVPDFVIPDTQTPPSDGVEDVNTTVMVRGRDTTDMWHVAGVPWGPVSPHLVNYIAAHVVYAGRYAGVFWGTNKAFGLLMFAQLLLNCLHNIFSLNGYQVMYKVRSVSPDRVLAHMEGFLMTVPVTVAVFTITQLLVLLSSCILYHYGWTKFQHFIASEKEKYHIMSKHGYEVRCGYLPHGLALLWVLFTTGSTAPLLHDWVIVYTESYDTAVLAATLACLLHILLWVLLWMGLTLKSWWVFKVRVQISQATVAGPHSIRLVNEVQLTGQLEGPNSPLLVVGAGKTYLIQDQDPKRALMKTVMGAVAEKKAAGQEDEIYWVMPHAVQQQVQGHQQHQSQIKEKTRAKLNKDGNASKHKSRRHSRRSEHQSQDGTDSDHTNESESEYARLRDVSFPGPSRRSVASNVAPAAVGSTQQPERNENLPKGECHNDGEEFPIPPPECVESPIHCPSPPTPPPPLPPPMEDEERHPSLHRHHHHHHSLTKHHNHHQHEIDPDQPPPPPPPLQQPPPLSPSHQPHKTNQLSPHDPTQQQLFQHKQQMQQKQEQQMQQQKQHQQSMIHRSASPSVSAAHPKIKTVKGDSLANY